ncbi:MAG: stage II sporulation protein M, partial [Candidatus Eremiobacteraeota bacterium]|nr:stage II sporulation protein M [Candidatus Eremiobacteraeota bacterium]
CASVFAIAGAVAYAAVHARPLNAYALVPGAEIPFVQKTLHDSNFAASPSFAPTMSAVIITKNIQVAAMAFAGGMTLGVLTIWAILNNGLAIGALGALFAAKGFGLDFLATIAPHGVIEITAIQIAGAAGLLLAAGILAPGPLRRTDALKVNARRALTLLVGVACLLVVAGTIEGFFSPLRTPVSVRLAAGAFTAVALGTYFIGGFWLSRRDRHRVAQR